MLGCYNFSHPLSTFLPLPASALPLSSPPQTSLKTCVYTPWLFHHLPLLTLHPLQSGFHPVVPKKQLPQRSPMTSVLLNPKDILQFSSYLQLTRLTTLSFLKILSLTLAAPSLPALCTFSPLPGPDLLEFLKAEARACLPSPFGCSFQAIMHL